MGITFDENIVERDNVPFLIPRDANFDAMSLLGGFDENNVFRFASFTPEGKLRIDASVTIENVDIGDVNIRVKDLTGADLLVSGGTNPDGQTKFLYAQDQRMHFNQDELQVGVEYSALPDGAATEATLVDILEALGAQPNAQRISQFGSNTFIAGVEGTIVSFVVPAGKKVRVTGVRGWADVDAEYAVKIGALQIDGYRTTPADITMDIDTSDTPYANAGDTIYLTAQHYVSGAGREFKGVIQGVMETV